MAGRLSNIFRQGPVTVEALSRRVDGCSRRFSNRQLREVRWAGVHPACFRRRHASRQAVIAVVSNIKDHLSTLSARASKSGESVNPICFAVCKLITNSNFVGCSNRAPLPDLTKIIKDRGALTLPTLV